MGRVPARHVEKVSQSSDATESTDSTTANVGQDIRPDIVCHSCRRRRVRRMAGVLRATAHGRRGCRSDRYRTWLAGESKETQASTGKDASNSMSFQELGRIHAEDHTLRVTSFPDRKDSYEELAVLKGDTAEEFDEFAGRGLHVGSCDDELVKFGVTVKDIVICLVMNADR
jgi:hypothetical protein